MTTWEFVTDEEWLAYSRFHHQERRPGTKRCPCCLRNVSFMHGFRHVRMYDEWADADICVKCEENPAWFQNSEYSWNKHQERRRTLRGLPKAKKRKPRLDKEHTEAERLLYQRCRDKGITTDDYWRMHEHQQGKCAQCGKRPPLGLELHIDHCHYTEQVRGLLCVRCNTRMGQYDDDPRQLQDAIDYLDNPPWRQIHAPISASGIQAA